MAADMTWDDVLGVAGFSSALTRKVLNRAVSTVPRARILEVGSFRGSTTAAMCFGNQVECIHCIDNHSEFGNTRAELREIAERFRLPATIHDCDYFGKLPPDMFGGVTFNVYHYDGPHDEHLHARELAIALPYLAGKFVYIVDDYSWTQVRAGCEAGLLSLADQVNVISRNVYESTKLNDEGGYWNGVLVAWCEKR